MSADLCASVKTSFIICRKVRVLVMFYLRSKEGLNVDYNCQNSIRVDQGINYSMGH